jgi:hypothetical protein
LLYIREYTENPVLLFALGSDKVLEEHWDENTGTLRFRLKSPAGARLSMAVYSPPGKPSRITVAGEETRFVWYGDQKLALFDVDTRNLATAIEMQVS